MDDLNDPAQDESVPGSRTAHFQTGVSESSGLVAQTASQNARIARGFAPNSVLQQAVPSLNGTSAATFQQQLMTKFPQQTPENEQ